MALRDDVLKYYPQWAWALDNPEIRSILERATSSTDGGWDAGRFTTELQKTQWWKGTEPSRRIWQEKVQTDPASLDESIRQFNAKFWDVSQSLGLNLPANIVDEITRRGIEFGWNDQQFQDALVSTARTRGYQGVEGNLGTISTAIAGLKKSARDYYVTLDDNTAFQWASQVAAGERKLEDFQPMLQSWGKSRFSYAPEVVNAIDSGMTVYDFFAGHRNEIAKYLEVAPDGIDLTSPQWQAMTEVVDPSSGQRRLATIAESGKAARKDPRWRRTQNGQAAGSKLVASLDEMFLGR